jgi:hypothetical protein
MATVLEIMQPTPDRSGIDYEYLGEVVIGRPTVALSVCEGRDLSEENFFLSRETGVVSDPSIDDREATRLFVHRTSLFIRKPLSFPT